MMDKIAKKLDHKHYKQGVSKLLDGNEKKFIHLVADLQESVRDFTDMDDILEKEHEYDENAAGIDLWHLQIDAFHREIEKTSRNFIREEIMSDILKMFKLLNIKFKNQ